MRQFNSDVMARLLIATRLVNTDFNGPHISRPDRIFTEHGYSPPTSDADWAAIARIAHDLSTLMALIAARDHAHAVLELNRQLAARQVTLQLEDTHEDRSLHFHAADASFAGGWAAGITAALAIAYSAGEAERIGRCQANSCSTFFLDQGRNRKRRFCSLQCQNRAKSAAYRERRSDPRRTNGSTHPEVT